MNAVVHRGKLDPQAAPGATSDVAVSQKQLFWRQFRRHRLALVSAAVLCALAALVILAPWIAPYPFDAIDPTQFRKPPSPAHIMGTTTSVGISSHDSSMAVGSRSRSASSAPWSAPASAR